MNKNNEKETKEISWPKTEDLLYWMLADKILELCQELAKREKEKREHPLVAARKIWPQLRKALSAVGREVGLNNQAEPVMPEWAEEPVVAIDGYYGFKPKTRLEILKIALSVGDGTWATIGDLWLWVGGGGPIVEKTLEKYEFHRKKEG